MEIHDLKVSNLSLALVDRWQIVQWGYCVTEEEDNEVIEGISGIFKPYDSSLLPPVLFCRVEVGQGYCIALGCFGEVYSWGQNQYGQLGTMDDKSRTVPTLLSFFSDVAKDKILDIRTRNFKSLALSKNG